MTTLNAPSSLIQTPDDESRPLYEIVDGVELEKPMSLLAQLIGFKLGARVEAFLGSTNSDDYVITEPWVACFEWSTQTRRRPDVAYWRRDQFPDGIPLRGDATVAPVWVIEVISPGDQTQVLYARIADYFRAGTQLFWIVDPAMRTVRTERPDGTAHAYRAADTLNAAPVLPGFSAKVADFFPA